MNWTIMTAIIATACLFCPGAGAYGQTVYETEDFEIFPAAIAANDVFGGDVSLYGETALVGSSGDDDQGNNSGSAFIFTKVGTAWNESVQLLPADGGPDDRFGASVTLFQNRALVGKPGRWIDSTPVVGSAYIFRYDGSSWYEELKLSPSDGQPGDAFGYAVDLSGDLAVVGAPSDYYQTFPGAAYVYRFDGSAWIEEAKLSAHGVTENNQFGQSISISEDSVLIGAGGAVYLYRYNGTTWVEDVKIEVSDSANGSFGKAVSLDEDVALVGAPWDREQALFGGAAYVFRYIGGEWVEEVKLFPSAPFWYDEFGRSVDLAGDTVLIGAPEMGPVALSPRPGDGSRDRPGSVWVFRYTGSSWVEEIRLRPSSHSVYDRDFFYHVSLSGNTALIGSPGDRLHGFKSGSAYIFENLGQTVSCQYTCMPVAGTLPFITNMRVALINDYNAGHRRIAANIRVEMAGGQIWNNWNAGYSDLAPGQSYVRQWNQNIPAVISLLGTNQFSLRAADVTPSPYNQPPYMPSGDTASETCMVTGLAP